MFLTFECHVICRFRSAIQSSSTHTKYLLKYLPEHTLNVVMFLIYSWKVWEEVNWHQD